MPLSPSLRPLQYWVNRSLALVVAPFRGPVPLVNQQVEVDRRHIIDGIGTITTRRRQTTVDQQVEVDRRHIIDGIGTITTRRRQTTDGIDTLAQTM